MASLFHPIDPPPDPLAVLAAWPTDLPLCALWAGEAEGGPWTVLGKPGNALRATNGTELRAVLSEIGTSSQSTVPSRHDAPPGSGWFGWLSYDAGRAIEPAIENGPLASSPERRAKRDRDWPLAEFRRLDSWIAFNRDSGKWLASESASKELLPHLRTHATPKSGSSASPPFSLQPFDESANRDGYLRAVERALELIRSGDVYQVNVAHRLSTGFSGCSRSFFAALARAARPWYGGYLEGPHYAIASASPELFLSFDPGTRELTTRPMKGTRAIGGNESAPHHDLETSLKDRAELAMIVDLMRNDLGRVCDYGSVRVTTPRRIERHASGVLQSTATVTGKLRPELTLADALLATFPAGSVTGAPKIRAMQIIDELEPVRRGPYCGSMVWLGDDGRMRANVMIRTAVVSRDVYGNRVLDYCAGAGIVADSRPADEWAETLAKARILGAFL